MATAQRKAHAVSDDRDFDPRFDPAFQRGYEGVVDAPAPARRAAAAKQRPTAEPEPVIGLPPTVDSAASGGGHPVPQAAPRVEADDVPARANPFLIALVVVAVALVGGGVYLVVKMRDLFAATQSSTDFDFVTLQVLIGVAPIAIGLGVATAIGVLFIFAVRWGRQR